MKRMLLLSSCILTAYSGWINRVEAYPVPTSSYVEIAQAVIESNAQLMHYKTEVDTLLQKYSQITSMGVMGYQMLRKGDYLGLAVNGANLGLNEFRANMEKKNKAKEAALKESQEKAQQNLLDQQAGAEAAQAAVEQNREIAAENKKKAFRWIPGAKKIVNGVATGFGLNSEVNSVIGNAIDTVSDVAGSNKSAVSDSNPTTKDTVKPATAIE